MPVHVCLPASFAGATVLLRPTPLTQRRICAPLRTLAHPCAFAIRWKTPGTGKTTEAVIAAIKAGYRNIDAANDYNNEHEVGAAIAKCIADGIVKREDLFIQCKLWNSNHRKEHVKPDLMQSLKDLQVDYVDNFVIHWCAA